MKVKQSNGLIKEVKHRGPCSFYLKRQPYINERGQRVDRIKINLGGGLVVYNYRKPTLIEKFLGVKKER